jgi:nucleotide-binding universal stress UspA family protein
VFAHRVIVGASGSPGSIPALRYAGRLAGRDGAPLVAVHAWLPPGGDLADRRAPSLYLRRVWTEAAGRRLREALELAWGSVPSWLDVESRIVRGEPGPVLVGEASRAGDLLVVGAGRRGSLSRARHGKVSRYCVARASCPVLAVPPAAQPRRAARGADFWSPRHREVTVEQALREWEREDLGRL